MLPPITVWNFCRLFLEPDLQKIKLVDIKDGESSQVAFEGTAREAWNSDYQACEIQSIDTLIDSTDTIVINICTNPEDF